MDYLTRIDAYIEKLSRLMKQYDAAATLADNYANTHNAEIEKVVGEFSHVCHMRWSRLLDRRTAAQNAAITFIEARK